MNTRTKYSYTVLRYVHDLVTGEFVNVGIVLFAPDSGFLGAKFRSKLGRLTDFFPEARGTSLRKTLSALEREVTKAGERMRSDPRRDLFDLIESDVMPLARKHVPADDSALQWSAVRGGLSRDPAKTLGELFERTVSRYDAHSMRTTRTDDDVWKSFSRVLQVRKLDAFVTKHEVTSSIDTVQFDKAIKNGKWHILEPVSFDLLDGVNIKKKAREIVGQMTVLKESADDFDVYLLVGEPKSPDVRKEYEVALRTLDAIPVSKHVFRESQAEEFGVTMSAVMAEHG